MKINKKGADLPMNVIIIAAIVLIVLVVLWAIFTGRMGVFTKGLADVSRERTCAEAGGVKRTSDDCGTDRPILGKYTDISAGESCCKLVGKCTGTYTKIGGTTGNCEDDFKDQSTCKDPCVWENPTT